MEKMGWSRGKGLGKNEDGIVDNLKISYKNDSKGRYLPYEKCIVKPSIVFNQYLFIHGAI